VESAVFEDDWRRAEACAGPDDISPADLAWEFLRRNPAYRPDYAAFRQRDAAGGDPDADARRFARWGLSFPADQLRPRAPKLAGFIDQAETDVLAYMSFPKEHRTKLHSNNPIERVNGEIKRRTEVVGIFPNEAAIVRLVGAILLGQNDEWAVQRSRYMTVETLAPLSDDPPVSLPACQPWPSDRSGHAGERGDHTAAVTPRGGTRPRTAPLLVSNRQTDGAILSTGLGNRYAGRRQPCPVP
jgi:hypothetical protein